jgi:glycosyltransferase involved in cell wall biosynthesis
MEEEFLKLARVELRGGRVGLGSVQKAIDLAEREVGVSRTPRPVVCLPTKGFRFMSRTLWLLRELVSHFRFVAVGAVGIGKGLDRAVEHVGEIRPNLCWIFYPNAEGAVAMGVKKRFKVPYIMTGRGEYWHTKPRYLDLADSVASNADRLIGLSQTYVRNLCARLARPYDDSVTVIPNGIHIPTELSGPMQNLPSSKDRRVLAVLNMKLDPKAQAARDLIAAFERQANRGVLIVATSGGGLPTGQLSRRVFNVGFVSDIYSFLQSGAVFLHHSYLDSQPTVILEAMVTSIPCVVSKHPNSGAYEIVSSGRTGYAYKSLGKCISAVMGLLANPEKRRTLGAAGRRMIENKYSWANTAKPYVDLIDAMEAPSWPKPVRRVTQAPKSEPNRGSRRNPRRKRRPVLTTVRTPTAPPSKQKRPKTYTTLDDFVK